MQCRRPGFNPWLGKIPWRRERLPTPVQLVLCYFFCLLWISLLFPSPFFLSPESRLYVYISCRKRQLCRTRDQEKESCWNVEEASGGWSSPRGQEQQPAVGDTAAPGALRGPLGRRLHAYSPWSLVLSPCWPNPTASPWAWEPEGQDKAATLAASQLL